MKKNKILFIFVLSIISTTLYAQDIIIKNDKSELQVKIIEVLYSEIKYKRWEMLDGPTYTMHKTEIFMVLYKSGIREYYAVVDKDNIPNQKNINFYEQITPSSSNLPKTSSKNSKFEITQDTPKETTPINTTPNKEDKENAIPKDNNSFVSEQQPKQQIKENISGQDDESIITYETNLISKDKKNKPTLIPPQSQKFSTNTPTQTTTAPPKTQNIVPSSTIENKPSSVPPQSQKFVTNTPTQTTAAPPKSQNIVPSSTIENKPSSVPPQSQKFVTNTPTKTTTTPPKSQNIVPSSTIENKPSSIPPQSQKFVPNTTNVPPQSQQTITNLPTNNKPSSESPLVQNMVQNTPTSNFTNNSYETNYRRISLYSIMIDEPNLPHAEQIKEAFTTREISDKFNDHNLSERVFDKWEVPIITTYIPGQIVDDPFMNAIAKQLVSKWFNRSKKGGFNLDLIKERGLYDASALDITTAMSSKRGLDLLADAGEDLIAKTFLLIHDFKYTDKEVIAQKTKGFLNLLSSSLKTYTKTDISSYTNLVNEGVTIAGKGYIVKTNASLFQLVWNEEVASIFYNYYWADDKSITPEKKKAYDDANLFRLRYIGSDNSFADVQSSIYTKKTDAELVDKATIKAVDKVIVKLQKEHDQFMTKAPIYSSNPLTVKIGLKEGLTTKSIFDVLEQRVNNEGKMIYTVVGQVKVDATKPIWDNQYGADEENPDSKFGKTYLVKTKGPELYPGMLLVQKKGK